ncbi:hypothetical protein ACI2KR_26960 [Pseudomonas luteola]
MNNAATEEIETMQKTEDPNESPSTMTGEKLYSMWVQYSTYAADKFSDLERAHRDAWDKLASKVQFIKDS